MTNTVYVYCPKIGVNEYCAEQISKRLTEYSGPSSVVPLTDKFYLKRELKNPTGTLVIPGGSTYIISGEFMDSPMVPEIRAAIDKGWSYLGSCAGGNFGSRSLKWIDPMIGFPFLDLLPVRANSEVFSSNPFENKNARVAKVEDSSGLEFDCFWQGGSNFEVLDKAVPIQIEAVYEDLTSKPAAVISGKYGNGPVVLLGLHPEIPFTELKEHVGSRTESAESKTNRKAFLEGLFRKLGIQEQKDRLEEAFSNLGIQDQTRV